MSLKSPIVSLLAWAALSPAINAQNNVTAPTPCSPIALAGAHTQNFNGLAMTGTANGFSLTGWQINESGSGAAADGAYRAGTGSDTAGDLYSFGTAGSSERALGQLRSGSNATIIGACFQNASSATITALNISYRGELWRSGTANRSNPQDQMNFQFKTGATSVTDASGWTDVDSLDFVSSTQTTSGAKDGNTLASNISGTISGLTILPGGTFFIRWTDIDPSGSDDGMGIDDFTITPTTASGSSMSIESAVSVNESDPSTTLTVTISAPAGAGGVAFTAQTANGSATENEDYTAVNQSFTILEGATTATVAVPITDDSLPEGDETLTVTISNAPVGYTITNPAGTVTIVDNDPIPISQIQGSGLRSPRENQNVLTRGVVTQVIGKGFFLQSLPSDEDGDPATSEGLFVFTGTAGAKPVAGDLLSVSGRVTEYTDDLVGATLTQISTGLSWTKTGTASLPAFASIPAADLDPNQPCSTGTRVDRLEKYESMRVTLSNLTVTQSTDLASDQDDNGTFYATLSSLGRRFREPGIECNSTLRNGSTPIVLPMNLPYFDSNPEIIGVDTDRGGLPRADVAIGTPIPSISGVLDWSKRTYVLIPSSAVPATAVFPPSTPVRAPRAGEFTVVSMNIERLTIGSPTVAKVGMAIRDRLRLPDIIAFQEAPNEALLDEIANAAKASPSDPPIYESYLQTSPNDAIHVGFLIKTTEVSPGKPRVQFTSALQVGVSDLNPCNGTDLNDRPPYILRATVNSATGALPLTVVGVHQRSLLDLDEAASGNCNRQKRLYQTQFLANLAQGLLNSGEKLLILGDFNAYQFNDGFVDVMGASKGSPVPADQVIAAIPDMVNPDLLTLSELLLPPSERWSYFFRGDAQMIDHILGAPSLLPNFSAMAYLHNNASYPGTLKADTTRPERFSDHDNPVAYLLVDTPDDITSSVQVALSGLVYNRANQTFTGTVTITNVSGTNINRPMQLVWTNLPAGVTVAVPESDYYQQNPFKTVTAGGLAAGQSVTVQVAYRNPSNAKLTFLPKVYAGSF